MTEDGTRKRAPITGTAFDFIRVEVPCPKCEKNSPQPLAELVANDSASCRVCGFVIDISTESWRARLAEQAEEFMQIKKI